MRTPSDRDESICAMFDSFCVTVIRNYSRNLKRAAENRKKSVSANVQGVSMSFTRLFLIDFFLKFLYKRFFVFDLDTPCHKRP